jgi:hypothetical protein
MKKHPLKESLMMILLFIITLIAATFIGSYLNNI